MHAYFSLCTQTAASLHSPFQCAGHDGSVHQQVASALGFLCFANVPPPPPGPWAEAHKMLARALAAAAGNREQEEEAAGLQAALQGLDLDW